MVAILLALLGLVGHDRGYVYDRVCGCHNLQDVARDMHLCALPTTVDPVGAHSWGWNLKGAQQIHDRHISVTV